MTSIPGILQQSIASNKFYPPRINQSQSIIRHNIISQRLAEQDNSRRIVVVEAQAGQGKTTLVHQYLEHSAKPFIWYQIGTEDSDPVLLLSALLLALSRKIEDFTSPKLTAILENGQIGPMDLQGCANILLNDIDASLKEDIFLVFDDLHLISESQLTNTLIDYLIDTSPPRLNFILTSRHPLQLNAQALRKNPYLVYLNTEDLALSLKEIENLYNSILKTEITRSEAEEILAITDGWIMGIVLAAHPFAQGGKRQPRIAKANVRNQMIAKGKDGYILSYFEDEIFSHVPKNLHQTFLKLAFLDEIDTNLAKQLSSVEDIDEHLDRMADENFFVYRLDDENRVFRFHHLFQEFLQIMGRQVFGNEMVASIYRRAADYYLEHDLTEKALKALRIGEDFERMEAVLQGSGLQLVAANRTVTILGILQSIPEKILLSHSWLAFFHGLLSTDFTPQQTLPFFEACRAQFAEKKEEAGELMALTQLIYFHFVISGNYRTGSALLERTSTLFEQAYDFLPKDISIIVARNLAAGYCFFEGKMDTARHYAQIGCDLATQRDSKNFIAASRFILGYIGLLSGNRRVARAEIEKSYGLASEPLVGMSNRLTLHIMQLCELSMHGDFPAFLQHKDLLQASVDQKVVRQTIAAPYLFIWSAIALLAGGKTGEAYDVIEQGMLVSKTAASGHMTSQFLQWRAFIHALSGKVREAMQDIEESTAHRGRAGGPFYIAYNQAIKGAALAVLGSHSAARTALTEGLELAEKINSPYAKVCCLAYLAYVSLLENDLPELSRRLQEWLQLMQEEEYTYFWGWEPKCMVRLFCAAVKMGIEPDFVRLCARQRLSLSIADDGTPLPLLVIRVLGTFSLGTATEQLFGPQDLSVHQRELIGLLIASPEQRISQEQVQLAFWPDSPPDKARKTFDTLMTRLRKTLSDKLPAPVKSYIYVEKGFVQLHNVSIDAVTFMQFARLGQKLGKQGLWWQAGNAFTRALSCWVSINPLETFISDQAIAFNDDLQDTMRTLCLTWSSKLSELNRFDEALSLLEKTDKLLSIDEDTVMLRHQLYLKKHNPLKARDILKAYRQELLRLGYSEDEADEVVFSLTEDHTVH